MTGLVSLEETLESLLPLSLACEDTARRGPPANEQMPAPPCWHRELGLLALEL